MVTAKNHGTSVREMIHRTTGDLTALELAPRSDWSEMRESDHFVQFYETEAFLQPIADNIAPRVIVSAIERAHARPREMHGDR